MLRSSKLDGKTSVRRFARGVRNTASRLYAAHPTFRLRIVRLSPRLR